MYKTHQNLKYNYNIMKLSINILLGYSVHVWLLLIGLFRLKNGNSSSLKISKTSYNN